ncbi:MAG: DUF1553 domain-containing protein [Planctomycetes bacterium]|nr:DUF1553 domain-containing protein [Planctomycetota bacterium]
MRGFHLLLCRVFLAVAAVAVGPGRTIGAVDFERDVHPILRARCFECHDGRRQQSGLRLDVRSRATRGGESGKAAIVAGQVDDSELIRRIATSDADLVMPPEGERLTAEQIRILMDWVREGASWPDSLANERSIGDHWAFKAPQRPIPPGAASSLIEGTPVDAFILERLNREGLKLSPPADKATLARRLHLDLIGLPPAPEQIDAFVTDPSPQAYERLVTQLLESPHYGERWGRLWLDAARYADSDGFEKDKPRFVHFYRDWVIQALNRDLPYDQFVIEQIAGDLLPAPTQDQLVATGFLRNSMINEEGGIDPEQFRMEAMFDRMDAIGKSILGLTIQCGQCHSHKFDPLTQQEYYEMFAFLNNAHEANITVYAAEEAKRRAEIQLQVEQIENELRSRDPDWLNRMAVWEADQQRRRARWALVRPELDSSGGQKHYLLDDGSVLAAGYAPTKHSTEFSVKTDLQRVTAIRLELLNDANLTRGGPGRSVHGLFALTEFKVQAGVNDDPKALSDVKIGRAAASANAAEGELDKRFDDRSNRRRLIGPITFAIDGKDETAWSPDIGWGRSNVPQEAVFVLEQPQELGGKGRLTFRLTQNHGGWNSDDNQNNNLGRFRFWISDDENADADVLPPNIREIVDLPREQRSAEQQAALFSIWRTTVPEWKADNERVEALWKSHPPGTTQLAYRERSEMRPTHLLKRGDFLKPVSLVTPGVPAFLHRLPEDAPRTRLTFARWLVDPYSPTTARAIVNRVWQSYFGMGIVSTSEDFGTQAEPPSHPELLDWLACEFMEPTMQLPSASNTPWSLKRLHQLIVLSATYRQSSRVTPALLAADPENRLLTRAPRVRVDAEIVRDIALAASGLLSREIGGPSVYPPIPAFLMQPPASYGPKAWPEQTGSARYRRATYTFRFRSVPYPALQAFDAPNGDFACVKRSRTNTPIQALTMLNEPVFVECAQALGLRTLSEAGPDDKDRLGFAFRQVLGRLPDEQEMTLLSAMIMRQRDRLQRSDADCWSIIASRPEDYRRLPNSCTPAEWATWTVLARVLLNLDETITKE